MFGKAIRVSSLMCAVLFSAGGHATGWYDNFTILQLQFSRGTDVAHIVYTGGSGNPNPDGCQSFGSFAAPYTSANPMREKAMLSGILTAYATGKTVRVFLSGCVNGIGGTTYPQILYFYSM